MAMVLLTYDLSEAAGINTAFKNHMKTAYNFKDQLPATVGTYLLPDKTLVHNNATKETVSAVFQAACREVGAHWEKYFVTEFEWGDAALDNQR